MSKKNENIEDVTPEISPADAVDTPSNISTEYVTATVKPCDAEDAADAVSSLPSSEYAKSDTDDEISSLDSSESGIGAEIASSDSAKSGTDNGLSSPDSAESDVGEEVSLADELPSSESFESIGDKDGALMTEGYEDASLPESSESIDNIGESSTVAELPVTEYTDDSSGEAEGASDSEGGFEAEDVATAYDSEDKEAHEDPSLSDSCENEDDGGEPKPRKIDGIFDFVELFVITMAAVLFLTAFVFRYSVVEGGSMQSTLYENDKLLISNLFYTPDAGDIVVLEDYTTALKKPLVKRVIATEGDTVRVSTNGIYVNGSLLEEPYVYIDQTFYVYNVTPRASLLDNPTLVYVPGEYYELVVPEDELFVMGDHRNKSTDSRDIGTVRTDAVLGKVILRFHPFDSFGFVE